LNGSNSYSQDSHINKYLWRLVSGPLSYIFKNPDSIQTKVSNMTAGVYAFELTVTDATGLFSKDTVSVTVNKSNATEYDLDIAYVGSYSLITTDLWDYETIYTYTEIRGNVIFQPFGELQISIDEYPDTPGAFIQVAQQDPNQVFLQGSLSVDFRDLIRMGGGPFNGTFNVKHGSARVCNVNIFKNLLPLTITGNLNVVGELVSFRIQGKVYF
jgi:hypothetical protein